VLVYPVRPRTLTDEVTRQRAALKHPAMAQQPGDHNDGKDAGER
jgi:hypothetical protein